MAKFRECDRPTLVAVKLVIASRLTSEDVAKLAVLFNYTATGCYPDNVPQECVPYIVDEIVCNALT